MRTFCHLGYAFEHIFCKSFDAVMLLLLFFCIKKVHLNLLWDLMLAQKKTHRSWTISMKIHYLLDWTQRCNLNGTTTTINSANEREKQFFKINFAAIQLWNHFLFAESEHCRREEKNNAKPLPNQTVKQHR